MVYNFVARFVVMFYRCFLWSPKSWIGIVLILLSQVRSDVPAAVATVTNEELKGTYERIDDEKIEMVYQLPSGGVVKGVLAVFHGCSHRATDWFPKSDSCKKCIGLPVERVIAKSALDSGLAVLALSSSNKVTNHPLFLSNSLISNPINIFSHAPRNTNVGAHIQIPCPWLELSNIFIPY